MSNKVDLKALEQVMKDTGREEADMHRLKEIVSDFAVAQKLAYQLIANPMAHPTPELILQVFDRLSIHGKKAG